MKQEIEKMEIGTALTINANIKRVSLVCNKLPGNYRLTKINAAKTVVIRDDGKPKTIKQHLFNEIENIMIFEEKIIEGDPAYIRNLVSKYNNENNKNIIVKIKNGMAVISENFMDKETITKKQYSFIERRFNDLLIEFKNKIEIDKPTVQDVIDEDQLIL